MFQFNTSCFKCVGEKIECKKCNASCIKHGKDARGKQRYICHGCGKTSVLQYTYKAYCPSVSSNIVRLTCEGCGIRNTARLLSISPTTVIRILLSIAEQIKKPPVIINAEFEMDELCTFVRRKSKTLWLAYAIERKSKQIVDFRIGYRNNKTLTGVIDTLLLSNASRIFTDGFSNYKYLIPERIHSCKRFCTNRIERMNLNIRTHLKRFQRRGISFSRSMNLMNAVIKIYFWNSLHLG